MFVYLQFVRPLCLYALLQKPNAFHWLFSLSDASQYAHYVFNTIKHNQTGKISFEVSDQSFYHALEVSTKFSLLCYCGNLEST